jgi:hypothetical protein
MGFYLRKRVKLGRTAHLNVSKSGVSASKRAGRVTVNSRGRVSVRVLPGLSFRLGGRR